VGWKDKLSVFNEHDDSRQGDLMKTNFCKQSKIKMSVLVLAMTLSSSAFASGPLVINDAYVQANGNLINGGSYTGTITTPAITVLTKQPIIILNTTVQGPGDLINAFGVEGADLTVLNSTGLGTNPNIRGVQKGIFIKILNPANLAFRNCTITGVRLGLYLSGYGGNHTHWHTIRIMGNNFINVDARPSDGKNDYSETGQYNGQALHFQNVTNVPAMEIGWNSVVNDPDQSSSGALIEFSETSGTPTERFKIHDNYIQGAFPTQPGLDLYQFGGILMNGMPTDTAPYATAYVDIYNNVIVATANYGIGIAAGHDISAFNNRVVSSGFLASGAFYPKANYGAAYGAFNINRFNQTSNVFFNNLVSNNVLGLIANGGNNVPVRSDWSLPGQGSNVAGNTSYQPVSNARPNMSDEAFEYQNWQNRLKRYKATSEWKNSLKPVKHKVG
jgi:hypothetical protein